MLARWRGFFFPFRRENFFLDLSFFPFLTFSLSLSYVSFHRSLSVPSCLFSFSFKIRSTFVFRSRPTPENDRVSLVCLLRFSFFVRPNTKRWKNYLFFSLFSCFFFYLLLSRVPLRYEIGITLRRILFLFYVQAQFLVSFFRERAVCIACLSSSITFFRIYARIQGVTVRVYAFCFLRRRVLRAQCFFFFFTYYTYNLIPLYIIMNTTKNLGLYNETVFLPFDNDFSHFLFFAFSRLVSSVFFLFFFSPFSGYPPKFLGAIILLNALLFLC